VLLCCCSETIINPRGVSEKWQVDDELGDLVFANEVLSSVELDEKEDVHAVSSLPPATAPNPGLNASVVSSAIDV
jgi:hypothetical protein